MRRRQSPLRPTLQAALDRWREEAPVREKLQNYRKLQPPKQGPFGTQPTYTHSLIKPKFGPDQFKRPTI